MKQLLIVLCFTALTGLAWIAPQPTPPPTPGERPTLIVVPTKTPGPVLCKCRYYFPFVEQVLP